MLFCSGEPAYVVGTPLKGQASLLWRLELEVKHFQAAGRCTMVRLRKATNCHES